MDNCRCGLCPCKGWPSASACGGFGLDKSIARSIVAHHSVNENERANFGGEPTRFSKEADIEKKYMSLVDGRGALALNIRIHRDGDKLTDEVRSDWTRFLLACLYRGPDKIAGMEETLAERLKEDLNADPKNHAAIKGSEVATPYDWIEKYHPHLVRDAARHAAIGSIESQNVGDFIINMEWSTFDLGNSKHELLTSDAHCCVRLALRTQIAL